jgi:hypothetical protein
VTWGITQPALVATVLVVGLVLAAQRARSHPRRELAKHNAKSVVPKSGPLVAALANATPAFSPAPRRVTAETGSATRLLLALADLTPAFAPQLESYADSGGDGPQGTRLSPRYEGPGRLEPWQRERRMRGRGY